MSENIHIGDIAIDSGRLVMVDPCRIQEVADTANAALDVVCIRKDFSPTVNMGIGVVLPTGLGDGIYPVIAHYETHKQFGRRIMGLTVLFDNPFRGFGCSNREPHKFRDACFEGSLLEAATA